MRIESILDLHSQFPDIDGYWGSNDLAECELKIRNALPINPDGEWSEAQLSALTQLVRVLNLQGKTEAARDSLILARKLILSRMPKDIKSEIRLMLEEGRHLCINMTPAKAPPFFGQAWSTACDHGLDYLAIEAAVMLAVSQPVKSQNEWLQRAIDLAEKTEDADSKLWLAQLYLMEGWHAYDFRRMDDALKYFNLALARPRQAGEMTDLIRIKWCVARCLRALGRVQEALDIQTELLNEITNANKVNGYVFLEMAECTLLLQRNEEAKSYFESAYKILSTNSWLIDNRNSELSRMQELYKKRY